MKRFSLGIIFVFLFVSLFSSPALAKDITVNVSSEQVKFDVKPIIEGDRVLVPVRAIFEALGAKVDWEQKNQTVHAKKEGISVDITVNNTAAYVNDELVTLDVPARNIKGRVLVPLRFSGEAFGSKVDWNGDSYTVDIYYDKNQVISPRLVTSLEMDNVVYNLGLFPNGNLLVDVGKTGECGEYIRELAELDLNNGNYDQLINGNYTFTGYGVSSKGEVLYGDGINDLFKIDAEGKHIPLTNTPNLINEFPAWSVDGEKIAINTFSPTRGTAFLSVLKRDGSSQLKFDFRTESGTEPNWSPDGSKITYTLCDSNNNGIWLVNEDGTFNNQILEKDGLLYSTFSPNGNKVLGASNDNFVIVNNDGSGLVKINGKNPVWSPDGNKIAFEKYGQLWLWNVVECKSTLITNLAAEKILWSESGSKVYFTSGSSIYMVEIKN